MVPIALLKISFFTVEMRDWFGYRYFNIWYSLNFQLFNFVEDDVEDDTKPKINFYTTCYLQWELNLAPFVIHSDYWLTDWANSASVNLGIFNFTFVDAPIDF